MINTFDALAPQRVSGALDYTAWPSVLPTQSEAWSGSDRFDVRRDGVELFCKFQVTDIKAETVAAGKTYTMAEKRRLPQLERGLRAQADAYRHRHCRGRGTMRETYVDL